MLQLKGRKLCEMIDTIFELLFEKAPVLFVFIVFVIIVAIALVIDDDLKALRQTLSNMTGVIKGVKDE